jgi:DNA-binding MarR family transcriptional regulator
MPEIRSEETLPARVASRPTWVLSRAQAYGHKLLAEAFAAAGVRGYHYRLLAALEEFGPASQATLSRRSMIDRADVVATLNDLAADGLIERAPDPSDGRRNVITLTAAGRKQLRALDQVVTDAQEQLLAPLSEADRKKLLGLLTRLVERDDE